jgi:hypothetical protein
VSTGEPAVLEGASVEDLPSRRNVRDIFAAQSLGFDARSARPMKYLVVGLAARLIAGMLSWWFHRRATQLRGEVATRPAEGIDPVWVSMVNVASVACIMGGVGSLVL